MWGVGQIGTFPSGLDIEGCAGLVIALLRSVYEQQASFNVASGMSVHSSQHGQPRQAPRSTPDRPKAVPEQGPTVPVHFV